MKDILIYSNFGIGTNRNQKRNRDRNFISFVCFIPSLWNISGFGSGFLLVLLRLFISFHLVILSTLHFPLVHADRPIFAPTDGKSPTIQLVEWRTSEDENNYYGNTIFKNDTDLYTDEIGQRENNTWVIYQNVAVVTFSCSANFPIQWTRELDEVDTTDETFFSRQGRCFRTAGNISDPKTFTFRVDLEFRTQSSKNGGFYRCESVENTRIGSEMYLFFEGITATIFPEAELHHVLSVGVNNQKSIVLPCFTSLPNIPVILSRRTLFGSPDNEIFQDFLPIDVDNQTVSFDSKIGFTIDVLNFPKLGVDSIEGTFKCSTNYTDDTNDHLIIHVVSVYLNNSGSNFEQFARGNASFYLERTLSSHTITCCSSTDKVPTLTMQFCYDPISCRFFYPRPTDKVQPMQVRRGRNHGNCVSEDVYPSEFGIFACFGDGIQAVRHLYSTQSLDDGSFKMYAGWSEIEPEFMIYTWIHPEYHDDSHQQHIQYSDGSSGQTSDYYAGETVNFDCHPHSSYFASGAKWILEWKNKTKTDVTKGISVPDDEQQIPPEFFSSYSEFHSGLQIHLQLNLSDEMENLKCLAPVWNSTKWIEKPIKFNVQPSLLLDWDCFHGDATGGSALYWNLGSSAEFSCSITGVPLPKFKFYKDDRILRNKSSSKSDFDADYVIKAVNVTKEMMLVTVKKEKVTHDNHGIFTLVAKNFAGEKKINIAVFVDEPENWAVILAIIFMLVLCILGLSFLAWKFVLQKRIGKNNVNMSYVNYKSEDDE